MHRALKEIRKATLSTPFENQVWLVGGAVRDELLGRPEPKDFDLVSEMSSQRLAKLLFEKGVSSIPPVLYPRFGTAMVRSAGATVEIVTARSESYSADSRKPAVKPATLLDDARRRDFTINALLKNLHSGELRDPLGQGLQDLENRVIRTPLEPGATFADDPLRMLRAIRFRWQFGFEPAPGLYEAILAERDRLGIISAERVQEEFNRMLGLENAGKALEDLRKTGLLGLFAPELGALAGVEQGAYHHLDAWEHTLLAVDNSPADDLVLRLAALFHDAGKPETRTVESDGRTRFFNHEKVGAEITARVLRRLKYSNDTIAAVVTLVANHMRLHGDQEWTHAAARRLVLKLGPHLDRLFALVKADRSAHRLGAPAPDVDAVQRLIETVAKETPSKKLRSPLTGNEIQTLLKIPEGPEVGKWKAWLTEEVLDGRLKPGDKPGARRALRKQANRPS